MPAVGREQDPVAFAEHTVFTLTLDAQARGAGDDKNPLIAVLVVPLALSSRLTGRHDALDAEARVLDKQIDDLIWQGLSR